MAEQQETLTERMARFRSGRWTWIEPYATSARVTVNRFGAKKLKRVYRAQATRHDGRTQLRELCCHNHLKREQAEKCTRGLVRELNAELDREK